MLPPSSTLGMARLKPVYLVLVLACIVAAAGQVLLKIGAGGRTHWQEFVNWPVFFGLSCYGFSTLLWLYSLSKLPLRVVYPFTVLSFIMVLGLAWVVLGERAGWRAGLGTALVLAGLVLITTDPR